MIKSCEYQRPGGYSRAVPVEMASVVLVRSNDGTQTVKSGAFKLKVKKLLDKHPLIISFVNLQTYVLRLGGKTNVGDIVLQLIYGNILDETIFIAYGTTSERFRTGDVAMVKAVDIEKMLAFNVVEALAARVAGLNVWKKGSFASSVDNIRLRGVNIIPPDYNVLNSEMMHFFSRPLMVVNGLP